MKTNITIEYSLERIADLLCSAFEGGSNYWYMIERFIKPPVVKSYTGLPDVYRHLDYPLSPGGALVISDEVGSEGGKVVRKRLSLKSIQRGLKIFAEKYPNDFADWRSENDDANTGDIFLQLCLFGEVVYG